MGSVPNQSQYLPQNVFCGIPACEGRKAITVPIDFSIGSTFQMDLGPVQMNSKFIDSVQALYIDNASNTNPLTVTAGVTNQRIIFPAGYQGYMPILQPNPPVLSFSCAAAVTVKVQVLNFFMPPIMWSTGGSPTFVAGAMVVTDVALDNCIAAGAVNVQINPLTSQGLTDASGAIAVGGTGQIAIPANASRKRWIIMNPAAATENLQISFGAAAAGKIDLVPGQGWDESGVDVVGDAVYVVAVTGGHAFTAYYK